MEIDLQCAPQRHDEPLAILVRHYGHQYATAYRAVVDSMPARNAAEAHMRGRVAHHFAVLTCRGDLTASDRLTITATALGYAEQQAGWGASNARAATAYAAVCSECAVTE